MYPENEKLVNKSNFAIGLQGGGARSIFFSYGLIRTLKDQYNFSKIKYLFGASGSTLFIIPYLYYNQHTFDIYYSPENCTLYNLNVFGENSYGKFYSSINYIEQATNYIIDKKKKIDINLWISLIEKIFFEEYKNIPEDQIKVNLDINPYPIISGAIYYDKINTKSVVEFTPDYYILPIRIYDSNNIPYGGYSIEKDKFCVNYDLTKIPKITGIATNVIDGFKELITNGSYTGTKYNLYNPITNTINTADLVDGGLYDDTGLLSLLRRKVTNIHIYLFSDKPINSSKYKNTGDEIFTIFFEGNFKSENNTLFRKELWTHIYATLLDKLKKGESLIINFTTEILDNDYLQVKNYGPINFLIHLTSKNMSWFNKLPLETQKIINDDEIFPYYGVTKLNYDPKISYLMYNLISWEILNSHEYQIFYSNL